MARLSLGLLLIATISAVLLWSDLDRRNSAPVKADRVWNLRFVQMTNVADVEESEAGIRDSLKESGLREGMNYSIHVANAQGDMATLPSLIDSANTAGADIIVTFSTPTLQAAIQRAGKTPVVFNYVASPFAAGAGKTNSDHHPNVTGVYLAVPYDKTIAMIRRIFPKVATIGTLYVPGESNSVAMERKLNEAAQAAGLRLESVGANTSVEVNDAAMALCSRNIDAIVQVPGNLTAVAFSGIARAARQHKMPVFCFQTNQVREGALAALASDYHGQGMLAGRTIARIIRGEGSTRDPFLPYQDTRLLLNLKTARESSWSIPRDLILQASEVIR